MFNILSVTMTVIKEDVGNRENDAMKYSFSETRRLWRPSKLIKTRLTGRDLLKILVADMKRKKIYKTGSL